jgi:glycerophosphoryl diester phosphodiesterase
MVDTKKLSRYGNTKMVAHMGAKGLETENTVAAYVASANRSYYGIETDVHITKDKRVIAIHDENAKRVSGVDILVEESNFDDLRKIRLFDNNGNVREDLCMPSLEDYISVCKRYGKIAVLELKNRMADEDVYMIYDIIESMGYNDSTVYISFSIENLHAIRKKNPTQTVQYLIGKNVPEDLVDTLKEYKYDLDIYSEAITKELLDACHAIGALVNVWTVDKVEKAEELVDMGIDFITTNIIE